jgi:hypothetical protein
MQNATSSTPESRPEMDADYVNWAFISDDYARQMFSLLSINGALIPKFTGSFTEYLKPRFEKFREVLTLDELKELGDTMGWISSRLADAFNKTTSSEHTTWNDEAQRNISPNVSAAVIQLMHESIISISGTDHGTLRKSLLVTAVSNFEILFGRMAQEVYGVNKSALNDSDYSFSLQELAEFDSLEEARQFLIERRVSALMRDSVDGWDKWLGRAVKGVSMGNLPVDWPATREVFARRNLIVHNGGAVNRIYLSLISQHGRDGASKIELGTKLHVDEEYFSTAVQNLLALGVLLITDVGRRLDKRHAGLHNSALLFNAELAMKRNAWYTSLAASKYLLTNHLSREDELKAQVINWVSRKAVHGIDEIRAEVTNWDISGLAEEFSHYKLVLLGEKEKAVNLVEGLLASKKITLVEVAFHPVYAEILDDLPSLSPSRAKRTADDDPSSKITPDAS